mgnify:CR=1 FL=1
MIDFNRPHLTGKETEYMVEAVSRGHLSGNGEYTKRCQQFFQDRKVLLQKWFQPVLLTD